MNFHEMRATRKAAVEAGVGEVESMRSRRQGWAVDVLFDPITGGGYLTFVPFSVEDWRRCAEEYWRDEMVLKAQRQQPEKPEAAQ
jgi:hypothetical protein